MRTVLAWSPGARAPRPFFAKLSLPVVLAGERRTVTRDRAAEWVAVSRTLERLAHPAGLQPLLEPLAIVPRDGSPAGYSVREIPPTARRVDRALVPWFALGAQPRPLVRDLARRAQAPLRDFVRRRLLRPFLAAWMRSALEDGWVADVHAQNLLVELDRARLPTGRFFVRDLEDVSIDARHVERRRPALAGMPPEADALDLTAALRTSLHRHFLGGPVHALVRAGVARSDFFDELERAMRAAGQGPPGRALHDPDAFAQWVEDRRHDRLPRPQVPRDLARWIEREQRLNDRRRNPRFFAPVSLRRLPQRFDPRERPVWRLEWMEVPLERVRLEADRVPATLRRALFVRRGGERAVRFFVHPFMRERYGLDLAEHGGRRGPFWATPTASPRSLVVWHETDRSLRFALKLSMDVALQRVGRLLRASKLSRAVAVNGCLEAIPARERRALGVAVLPEPLSLRTEEKPFGTIARCLLPDMDALVPGFSLFAGADPLALRLAGPGAEAAVAFVESRVFPPLVRAFAGLALGYGLVGDLHQQNALFRTGADGRLTGELVLRDLDSFQTDAGLRLLRGLTLAPFARRHGSLDDLRLDLGSALHAEVWCREVRAEWCWLAEEMLRRHAPRLGGRARVRRALAGRRLWARMDELVLAEAARWLGDGVVEAELRQVDRRGHGTRSRTAARWSDARDRQVPLYSLGAMVHAWKRAHPGRGAVDRRALEAALRRALREGPAGLSPGRRRG